VARRALIAIVIAAAVIGGGIAVWAASPLVDQPTPEPTPTPVPTVAPVTVKVVSGRSDCTFRVERTGNGWRLIYAFWTPGTMGTITTIPADDVLVSVAVREGETRPRGVIALTGNERLRIETTNDGVWQYAIRPPDGIPVIETFESQPPEGAAAADAIAQQAFRLRNCGG
jgi:hypothetical protein